MITQSLALLTATEYEDHMQHISVELLQQAVDDLKAHGWTKDDFARALRDMLEE